jgi:hypothetical protein
MVIIVVHLLVGRNESTPAWIPPDRSDDAHRGRLSA